MGREIKRVPLDFNHPLGKTWTGYICPVNAPKRVACNGTGSTDGMRILTTIVNLLMIAGEDGTERARSNTRRIWPHPYLESVLTMSNGAKPDDSLAELTMALAGRQPSIFGHDTCDRWSATKKIVKAAGLPKSWGTCRKCRGHGIPPKFKKKIDAWKSKEPPIGEGWQVWETVSEGSPVTPVFATAEALIMWMTGPANPLDDPWGMRGKTPSQARAFVDSGWAPSMILVEDRLVKGEDGMELIS